MLLNRLAGLGCLALLLCLPLQADHKRHRSRYREGYYRAPAYVEVHVGTPYGHGVFVRGYRPDPYGYSRHSHHDDGDYYEPRRGDYYERGDDYYESRGDDYYESERHEFRKIKYRERRYFKRHKHHHYDGHCPY